LGSYPPGFRPLRPLWAAAALCERAWATARSAAAEVTLLQRPMLSTLVTFEPLTRRPRVLDVDDAIWLNGDGAAARRLARLSDLVICGNSYLAEHFSRWNRQVALLATAVDTDRFCPAPAAEGRRVIGWSGTSSGFGYVENLARALGPYLDARPGVVLRIVADKRPALSGVRPEQIEFVRWSPENEVRALQDLAVGVMPLDDAPWSRGKCSFKLLTYMACGVPVVASPVGMNADVLASGGGLAASSEKDWSEAVDSILSRPEDARRMGRQGRRVVLRDYSIHALAPRLAALLRSMQGAR
ncbi:MAG: glycosyltransferase family 4 protein, partial [Bryobacteraceae bacterium]